MSRVERRHSKVRRTLILLRRMYGRRTYTPHGKGLDVLIEAMLSQNTNMVNSTRGYRALRRRFRSWTQVMNAATADVQRQIAICGLARMRAHRLQAMLRKIKALRGAFDIEFLRNETLPDAYSFLTAFHGIGPKTAAFTLLFAFEKPVLPIDNGILRVLRRTALIRPKARDAEAEQTMSPLIPARRHCEMHLLLFEHAKRRCRPKNPKCDECKLLELCPFGQRRLKHLPPEKQGQAPKKKRPPVLSRFISAGVPKEE